MRRTCCVTGHRALPKEQIERIRRELLDEIRAAARDGYATFLSGFAEGADLLFAECVLEARGEFPHLRLEAVLPYADRAREGGERARLLLAACDAVTGLRDHYEPGCFLARNRELLRRSARVIAVHDGRSTGGTAYTMRGARALGRELRVVRAKNSLPCLFKVNS